MRVCFLNTPTEYYSPVSGGAISTVIMKISEQFVARGHEVGVLTRVNGDSSYPVGRIVPMQLPAREDLHTVQRGISSLRRRLLGWDWPYYEFYRREFSKGVRKLQPDAVVLFNDLVSPKYLRRVLPGARIAVWLHNEWRTRQRKLGPTIESTNVFLTCSDYIRRWTEATHGIPNEQFTVVLSGVDLEEFTPDASRSNGNGAAGPLRVLFIGRIDPNKGPDIAADAVAALRREGRDVRLTVAGGLWWYGHGNEMADPFFRRLKTKMEAAGADYRGHVTRPEVPALVRQHDVVCVLSRSNEPFALVTLEAMASGCAVVASNRGGLPESCGGAAMLVDPDDFGSVVNCLRSLATDRKLLAEQKRKSLERARRASWSVCADVVENVLKRK